MEEIKNALALIEMGQVDEAYELLQVILQTASHEEKFVIVELFEEFGFIEDAVQVLEQLLQSYPTEGQIITKLAELYIELNEDELAIENLNKINFDDPFYVHALLLLADMYEREGLFEVAEQKLLEARELVDKEEVLVIDFALAELLLSIGQAQRAITFYEKISEHVEDINGVSITERLAESYTLLGNFEVALVFYDELTNEDPNHLFKHAFVAYQANELNRAIELWKKTIEMDPAYHPVYFELASAYIEQGDIKKAYDTAKIGVSYDEFDKRLFYIIGKAALQLGEQSEAIEALQEAIALDEDYKDAILLLASIYEQESDYEEMVEFLNDIKKIGGADPLYDWKLAEAYNELEEFEQAKGFYEEAYSHLKDDPAFLKEYGFFLIEDGSPIDGAAILRQYINLKPDDLETIAFFERIHFSNDDEI